MTSGSVILLGSLSGNMLTIDGSRGEGGGQILRTSMSLAALSGTSTRVEAIRANRSSSGLRPQHATAVEAAAEVCDAHTGGVEVGSSTVEFEPTRMPRAGEYVFSVGTAGSATLVLQTLIPPLLVADGRSRVVVEGGTHTLKAPPWEYLVATYLPVLEGTGASFEGELQRYGFYPKGGGRVVLEVEPPEDGLGALDVTERGHLVEATASSLLLDLPRHIARRELEKLEHELEGLAPTTEVREVDQEGTRGNALFLEIECEGIREVFSEMGKKGRPAEEVAERLAGEVNRYLATEAPVGPYLADQLVVPLAMAGGEVVVSEVTRHCRTQLELVPRFLEVEFAVESAGERARRIAL